MRPILSELKIEPSAKTVIANYHAEVVREAQAAVDGNNWVIIGMSKNPHVRTACKLLEEKGMKFRYIEHGGYLSKWKERLAIKLWSGWPTFPQVFHKGLLIGGADDLKAYLAKTDLQKMN